MTAKIRWISILRFAAIPLGLLMGREAVLGFGLPAGIILGIVFGFSFWVLAAHGRTRFLAERIAESIRAALKKEGIIDPVIELQKGRDGFITRVYVIGRRVRQTEIHNWVLDAISEGKLRKYLWVLQIAILDTLEDFPEKRRQMNEQFRRTIENRRG